MLKTPISYSVSVHRKTLVTQGSGGPQRARLRNWVESTLAGKPPSFVDGLELFHSEFPEGAFDEAQGGSTGRFLWFDYSRANGDILNSSQLQDGYFQSTLLTSQSAMTYRSSTDLITIRDRSGSEPSYFMGPNGVLSPLRTEPFYLDFLQGAEWSSVRESGLDTHVARVVDQPDYRFVICQRDGEVLPSVALDVIPREPGGEDLAFVLTLYNRIPGYAPRSHPLQLYEVLRFDSLGIKGKILMERVVVYRCEFLEAHPDGVGAGVPLELQVKWSSQTRLRDMREKAAQEQLGADVTKWPLDVVDRLHSW